MYKHPLKLILIFLICSCISGLVFAGPIIAPGEKLYVIKTLHFDIIYPEKSRPTALYLSTIVESIHAEVSEKLNIQTKVRIPVVISPDNGSFNGLTNLAAYPFIILFDTSLNLDWTSFSNNIKYLFLHELSHALSFLTESPDSLSLLLAFTAPLFMLEGVTVSLESGDGIGGRANDPLVRMRIRQDIIENRFKTGYEASGLYEEYPFGNIFYEYGGLFSYYLQNQYGFRAYAQFWKAMGTFTIPYSLDPYEMGIYQAFRNTYGISFSQAWADFRQYMALSNIAYPLRIVGLRGFQNNLAYLASGMTGKGANLYWIEARSKEAARYNVDTQKLDRLFDADYRWSITDVDAQNERLLVTRAIDLPDMRDRIESIEFDLVKRQFIPNTSWANARETVFFRNGKIGIVSNNHNTDLVFNYEQENHILLPGSESIMYGSPTVLSDNKIALIVAIHGKRNIGILDIDTNILSIVKPDPGDEELFTYIRGLSAIDGKLYFSWNSNDRMYKLGIIDGDQITLEMTDYSGGVLYPRATSDGLYYIGRFSAGDKLLIYPTNSGPEGSRSLGYTLEPFDTTVYAAESLAITEEAASTAQVSSYSHFNYISPVIWPALDPTVPLTRSIRVFLDIYFQDPLLEHYFNLRPGYDQAYTFADSSIVYINSSLPVTFDVRIGDTLAYFINPERRTFASLDLKFHLPTGLDTGFNFTLGGTVFAKWFGSGKFAYTWPYIGIFSAVSASIGYDGLITNVLGTGSRGFSITSYNDFDILSKTFRTEAWLMLSYDAVPLRFDFWGAWANEKIINLSSYSSVFINDSRPAYYEYMNYEDYGYLHSQYILQASLVYKLLDIALHSQFLWTYLNRLCLDIGTRSAYFMDKVITSAFVRFSLDFGASTGLFVIPLRAFFEVHGRLFVPFEKVVGIRFGLQSSIGGFSN